MFHDNSNVITPKRLKVNLEGYKTIKATRKKSNSCFLLGKMSPIRAFKVLKKEFRCCHSSDGLLCCIFLNLHIFFPASLILVWFCNFQFNSIQICEMRVMEFTHLLPWRSVSSFFATAVSAAGDTEGWDRTGWINALILHIYLHILPVKTGLKLREREQIRRGEERTRNGRQIVEVNLTWYEVHGGFGHCGASC